MRGGYYHTGDVASRDEDGYITYVGRSDDVFKASDYRISPFELESVLIEHPAVAEAAVVPSPDPVRLAVPKAYVVLAAGREPSRELAAEILEFCREHLAPYKRIRRIEFAELPKTISGKIRRVELRADEADKVGSGEHSEHAYDEADFKPNSAGSGARRAGMGGCRLDTGLGPAACIVLPLLIAIGVCRPRGTPVCGTTRGSSPRRCGRSLQLAAVGAGGRIRAAAHLGAIAFVLLMFGRRDHHQHPTVAVRPRWSAVSGCTARLAIGSGARDSYCCCSSCPASSRATRHDPADGRHHHRRRDERDHARRTAAAARVRRALRRVRGRAVDRSDAAATPSSSSPARSRATRCCPRSIRPARSAWCTCPAPSSAWCSAARHHRGGGAPTRGTARPDRGRGARHPGHHRAPCPRPAARRAYRFPMTDDKSILHRINDLVAEEHELRSKHAAGTGRRRPTSTPACAPSRSSWTSAGTCSASAAPSASSATTRTRRRPAPPTPSRATSTSKPRSLSGVIRIRTE